MGFGKDDKGIIIMESRSQALGVLAPGGGILVGTKLAITMGFRMLKSNVTCNVTGLTAGEGEHMSLYLLNGDLSLAEAEAKIEQNGPTARGKRTEMEIAERFVKKVGFTPTIERASNTVVNFVDAFTGSPICVTKPRWTFSETTSWQWLIYNHGVVLTTGATVQLKTESFGVWVE